MSIASLGCWRSAEDILTNQRVFHSREFDKLVRENVARGQPAGEEADGHLLHGVPPDPGGPLGPRC